MDVAIAGAHGKIGRELGRLLSDRGDHVRGLIRNPTHGDDLRADGIEPVACDLEAVGPSEIAAAIEGADAVVFAAGAGPGSGAERKWSVDRDGAVKLLEAARLAGVQRYLIVSSVGAESPPDDGDDVFGVYLQREGRGRRRGDGERPRLDGRTPGAAHRRPTHGSRARWRPSRSGRGHARRCRGGAGRVPRRAPQRRRPGLPGRRRRRDRSGRRQAHLMRVELMIEGQEDVTWPDWTGARLHLRGVGNRHPVPLRPLPVGVRARRARVARRLGDDQRARSRHHEARASARWCRPPPFRHPSELAKVVATADHVSDGRVELGMGTGWLEAEHEAYGFPFPPLGERMRMLEDQLQHVDRQWGEDSLAQPKPVQTPRPNLIVGGRGGPRSIRMAARYADEYNTVNKTAEECRSIREQLTAACADAGRVPIPLSLMTGWLGRRRPGRAAGARAAGWPSAQGSDAAPEDFLAHQRDSSGGGDASTRTSSGCASWSVRASSGSCSSSCCTETSTRERSPVSWHPRSPRPQALPARDDPSIFKAYDVRGIYPDQMDEDVAYRDRARASRACSPTSRATPVDRAAGRARARHAPVGARDGRARTRAGMRDEGADVIDVGQVGTEMLYWTVGSRELDGGLMCTASHNPKAYTGAKLVRRGALALSGDAGIGELRDIVTARRARRPRRPSRATIEHEDVARRLPRGRARLHRPGARSRR